MGNVTIYLHKSIQDFADLVSNILNTSRSEVVDTILRYTKDNLDLEDIFEGYHDAEKAYEEALEEPSEESEEEPEEEESEEEPEEEESEEEPE